MLTNYDYTQSIPAHPICKELYYKYQLQHKNTTYFPHLQLYRLFFLEKMMAIDIYST